ncbi:MAG: hypothetical protein WC821_00805 [archaeon]|jgi:hypothetical protein
MRWTKKLGKTARSSLANAIKEHRELQIAHFSFGYSAARRLASISPEINLTGIIERRISEAKRPIRFLDSGAGLGGISADLKKRFGSKLEVTTLSLRHPNTSRKSQAQAIAEIKKSHHKDYYPYQKDEFDRLGIRNRLTKEQKQILSEARKDSRIIDNIRVGIIENFVPKEKYDIIFDYTGPVQYSTYRKRVAMQYSKLLPKGGLLVVTSSESKEYLIKSGKFRIREKIGACTVFEKL